MCFLICSKWYLWNMIIIRDCKTSPVITLKLFSQISNPISAELPYPIWVYLIVVNFGRSPSYFLKQFWKWKQQFWYLSSSKSLLKDLRLELISLQTPSASKFDAQYKNSQIWLENNHLATLIKIYETLFIKRLLNTYLPSYVYSKGFNMYSV